MKFNIELAWERLKFDIGKRHFMDYEFQLELIKSDYSNYLATMKTEFESGNYNPAPLCICNVPKGKGLIRPGAHLTINDSLFYIALGGECYAKIFDKIEWSQNEIEFSYEMCKDSSRIDWFKYQFKGWSNFREKSLELLSEDYTSVVITDITGFYENIDIQLLISDLRNCGISNDIITQLSKCLNKWAQISKGIPQGQSPSDILAKLYINSVDLALKNSGIKHLRYVDDIRIFCKSKSEAKEALILLTNLLRKRGLNLQSAKTKILNTAEAKTEIESIFPIINQVVTKLREEIIKVVEDPYGGEYEIVDPEASISKDSEKVLEETFRSYFIEAEESKFNKSLFHYLLNRLKQANNSYALEYCLSIFESHPEETSSILEYTKSVDDVYDKLFETRKMIVKKIVGFLNGPSAVYDYQNNQLVNWLYDNVDDPDDTILDTIRNYAYDSNKPYYLQRSCRKFLGKYGNDSDIETIFDHYSSATSEMEKADIVCCLGKFERSRRNGFFGRIKNDGYLIGLAIDKFRGSN